MNKIILIIGLLVGLACSAKVSETTTQRLKTKAKKAKKYCIENKLDTIICVLIDMQIHSGKKRFFLWDFEGDSIIKSGMCTHGSCGGGYSENGTISEPKFNNIPNSHCSSLGKFKIGVRGYSTFGIHINYKLHGLEESNNKAYQRYIVFHSWNVIDDEETYPFSIDESWGCPAVSNNFMKEMDVVLKQKKEPVLMWIYN